MFVVNCRGLEYYMTDQCKADLEEALIKYLIDCAEVCSADMGATTFLGLPVSRLAKFLRMDRFRLPGYEIDQLLVYEALGASHTRARVKGYGAGNSWQRECTIVRIK